MNLKYRDTTDYREILRLLQKSSEQDGNLLWQNIEGKRQVFSANYLEIDFVGREVVVFLDNPSVIGEGTTLYFKLCHNDSIFKVSEFLVQQDCVTFKFPENIKTWEHRSSERYHLDANEEFTAILGLSDRYDAGKSLKVKLNNFSAEGLGLSISEMNRHIVSDNNIFWVHAINDFKLFGPIAGEVKHLSKEAKGKRYSFGVQLQKAIPIDAVKSIIS